ncbi:MAG: hypothetical protein AAGA83_27320 [Cyanobacteria bacterium P01_F01_bin.116]
MKIAKTIRMFFGKQTYQNPSFLQINNSPKKRPGKVLICTFHKENLALLLLAIALAMGDSQIANAADRFIP